MKSVLILGVVLCLAAAVTAKKAEKIDKENVEDEFPSELNSEHNPAKKYGNEHKYYHHHHHTKHQKSLDGSEFKHHGKSENKKSKYVSKSAPHEVPPHEAELQANLHTSKKHLKEQDIKNAQQDLHLQDLAFEETLRREKQDIKSSHSYQKNHHKNGHFVHDKASDLEQSPADAERKLFVEHNPKKVSKKTSVPVLEDSFEALQDSKTSSNSEVTKHNKKSKKHKKAVDKVKINKKVKNGKKDKKEKKNKKEKTQNW